MPEKQEPEQGRDKSGRFVPGVSGNPSGRPPRERALSDNLRARLNDEVVIEELRGRKTVRVTKTYLQLFIESQIKRAINGDQSAAKNVWDRIEGRVSLPLENDSGQPFVVVIDRDMEGV